MVSLSQDDNTRCSVQRRQPGILPGSQRAQRPSRPARPAAHSTHALWFALLWLPAEHWKQLRPSLDTRPVGHRSQGHNEKLAKTQRKPRLHSLPFAVQLKSASGMNTMSSPGRGEAAVQQMCLWGLRVSAVAAVKAHHEAHTRVRSRASQACSTLSQPHATRTRGPADVHRLARHFAPWPRDDRCVSYAHAHDAATL